MAETLFSIKVTDGSRVKEWSTRLCLKSLPTKCPNSSRFPNRQKVNMDSPPDPSSWLIYGTQTQGFHIQPNPVIRHPLISGNHLFISCFSWSHWLRELKLVREGRKPTSGNRLIDLKPLPLWERNDWVKCWTFFFIREFSTRTWRRGIRPALAVGSTRVFVFLLRAVEILSLKVWLS